MLLSSIFDDDSGFGGRSDLEVSSSGPDPCLSSGPYASLRPKWMLSSSSTGREATILYQSHCIQRSSKPTFRDLGYSPSQLAEAALGPSAFDSLMTARHFVDFASNLSQLHRWVDLAFVGDISNSTGPNGIHDMLLEEVLPLI